MKFSQKTLKILKNFNNINQSIFFREGNNITTIAPSKNVFAKAKVVEDIPKNAAIYDLSRFLSVISLLDDPDIDFQDKQLVITKGESKIRYTYADERVIVKPPEKNIVLPSIDVQFTMTPEIYSSCIKAMSILGVPELVIAGSDGEITLQARDIKNPSGDSYSIALGETSKEFSVVFAAENLKMMVDTYEVSISEAGLGHFKSAELDYFIAVEESSTFNV